MNLLEDMILVQKNTLKKTIKSFGKNWIIIFTSIVYVLINLVAALFVGNLLRGPLSILSGIITAIITSSLTSNYLYLLFNVINYNKITYNNFKDGFTQYLWKVYGIFFIAWIVTYVLSAISRLFGNNLGILITLFSLAAVILLNALPETLYQKYYSSSESIQYAFEFIKENWLNWFIPNVILLLILYLITGRLILNMFTTHLSFNMNFDIGSMIRYLIGQSLFSFVMIYRGHLFKLLSTSTRRKRMYMKKLYD
ncbi:hypothetical protein K8M07_11965 [Schnuerera sp. xch1]|uniref:hypothetical protein n=1 Tax=Schnuerera sp. xch1 TaxID=2874283 RepID=UPI001CBB1982|nr:hypothetical protein [Schnuerera sp. xch1]MBZ2175954.1 hypothetical protein [Schnuerera sp. xch1]